jgi:protein-S-isoprenylcysteine O-methyltransferase Ste14
MKNQYLVLMLPYLFGLTIRTGYERLKLAGMVNPRSKIVFTTVFAGMCLMLLSWPFVSLFDPVSLHFHSAIHLAGMAAVITGPCLAIAGMLQLRGLENIDHLVVGGIFSKLRHPMYTGFILWILGWIIYHGAMVSAAIGTIGIASILFWRSIEEEKLHVQFGKDYDRYKKGTWF